MNMKRTLPSLLLPVLVATSLFAIPAVGSALTGPRVEAGCTEPQRIPGSRVTSGHSGKHSCHCGIFITTHHRTCDTKITVTPDRNACNGPPSEVHKCRPGGQVFVEEITMQCAPILLGFKATVGGFGVSLSLPVCVGTECREVSRQPLDALPSATEEICDSDGGGGEDEP